MRTWRSNLVLGVVIAVAAVFLVTWGWLYWETIVLESARLEVFGISAAIITYIELHEGEFPPTFEALIKSDAVEHRSDGKWRARSRRIPDVTVPPAVPFAFDSSELIVAWGYALDEPERPVPELLVRHALLSYNDRAHVVSGNIRELLKRWALKKKREGNKSE